MPRAILIIMLTVLLFSTDSLSGQDYKFTSQNRKALKHYRSAEQAYVYEDYASTAAWLNKALKKDSDFIEAWLLMGDTYSELNEKDEAILAYRKAIELDPDFFPQVYFFLGTLCFEQANYAESIDYFEELLAYQEITSDRRRLGKRGLKRSQFAYESVLHPSAEEPQSMGDSINTGADEYINFVDETSNWLVFTRKVSAETAIADGQAFAEGFYETTFNHGSWKMAMNLPLYWQENLDLGGMSLSVDGRKMYFSGCQWPNGFGSCDLYISYRKGKKWEAPTGLGSNVNSQWWDSQPVISSDGKELLFSSKRNAGKGGADIWKSRKLPNGKWSPPINLGDSINTGGDEMAPFLHADGKTLYFSSTGGLGLGGFDVFVSRKDSLGRWLKAKNLGYPINTKHHEINLFVSLDGSKTWVSSDRTGGKGGFDIYRVPTTRMALPEKVLFVKGVVLDEKSKRPLEAEVQLTNLLKNWIEDSTSSDPITGEFLLVLHPGIDYAFNITKIGYLFYSKNMNLSTDSIADHIEQVFELTPIHKGKQITLDNIFFDFNSANLKPASRGELNKLLDLLKYNTELRLLIAGHTDSIGSDLYNQKLSTDRAAAVYHFLIENGVVAERLEYKGFGANKPVSSNEEEEGRRKNRRTEIVVL